MLFRLILNFCFRKVNCIRKFLFKNFYFVLQNFVRMNLGFTRKFTNCVFSTILKRNHIFFPLPKFTQAQDRKVVVLVGHFNPQYSTYIANHKPVSICTQISSGCISVFVGYLSVKLAAGIFNEIVTYIVATARLFTRTISLRFRHTFDTTVIINGNKIATTFIEKIQKIWSNLSISFPQVNFTPTPVIQNNHVNENNDSSKQQVVNNNNNNESLNPIYSTIFIYLPKFSHGLSLQNRPFFHPHINPNSYTIPRSFPINPNTPITIQAPEIPSKPIPTYTEPRTIDAISDSIETTLVNSLEKGCQLRKLGNPQAARRHFEISAKNGNPDAMTKLGMMYETGEGGERNHEKALYYLESASKLGHKDAINMALLAFNYRLLLDKSKSNY